MQLFVLHRDPHRAAQLHRDQDCVDMTVRVASLLGSAHVAWDEARYDHLGDGWRLDRDSREIYPPKSGDEAWVKWVSETPENYRWAVGLLEGFLREYQVRYGDAKGKRHRTWDMLALLRHPPNALNKAQAERIPLQMNAMTLWPDVVEAGVDSDCLRGIRDPVARHRCYYRSIMSAPHDWRDGQPAEFR